MEVPEELIQLVRTKEPVNEYEVLEKIYPDVIVMINRLAKEENNESRITT